MALGMAVAARGADHNRSGAYQADFSDRVDRRHADARTVPLAIETENQAALLDSLILCKFLRGAIGDLYAESARILTMVTGWPVTPSELRITAQRIVTARKLFNLQAGWTPAEDSLPDRFLTSSPADDPTARLTRETLQQLVREYYRQRRWTAEGWIPPAELRHLHLSSLARKATRDEVAAAGIA
jgi:aldehyde:ferredoxin oxidoreductase